MQERQPFAKAGVEVQFTPHGRCCDGGNLLPHACQAGQFIDDFHLNQGGIHVEGNQPAVTAKNGILLYRDIELRVVGKCKQLAPQFYRSYLIS